MSLMAFPFHFLGFKFICKQQQQQQTVNLTQLGKKEGEVWSTDVVYHLKTRFGCVVAISNNLCTNKEDNDELQKLEEKKIDGNIYTRNDQKQESAKANKINKHSFFFCSVRRYCTIPKSEFSCKTSTCVLYC